MNNNVLVDIVLSQDGYLDVLNNVIKDAASEIRNKLPIFNFRHIHHEQVCVSFPAKCRQPSLEIVDIISSLVTLGGF